MPPPRPTTPPSGAPAQRSPLHVGADPGDGHDDDRTSLVGPPKPSRDGRWQEAVTALRRRGPVRWSLLGVLALVQAFVLFSAVMWWLGSSAPSATATVAPMTWTGVVYDVGAAGVNMRSAAQVRPDDSRDTAARGARLALACGQTGDVVAKGPVKTATWLKTTDGLFVSMLYVRVPDKQSIPSCNGSKVDGPLVALADPAHPELPPPPGTQLGSREHGASGAQASNQSGETLAGGSANPAAPVPGQPAVPARAAGGAGGTAASGGTQIAAVQAPVAPPLGSATAPATGNEPPRSGPGGATSLGTGSGTGRAATPVPAATHAAVPDPDNTPVG